MEQRFVFQADGYSDGIDRIYSSAAGSNLCGSTVKDE
jgi:hypothetical protein